MKDRTISILILSLIVIAIGGLFYVSILPAIEKPPPPTTLNMELYSVTPHGHQVFKKCENGTCVFVLVRHHDGFPVAITSTCK